MNWLIIHEWLLLAIAALLGFLLCWLFCRKKNSHDDEALNILRKKYEGCQKKCAELQNRITQSDHHSALASTQTDSTLKLYDSPTEGTPDDLKRIKGIGIKLEAVLNEMGIYYYKQIAEWTPSEIEEVNERLKFKGRIGREQWVEQANILKTGENTRFSEHYDE